MLAHIPTWVFALLAFLIFIGVMQSRTRLISPARAFIPGFVLAALSLYGVIGSFGGSAISIAGWLAGFITATVLLNGFFAPRGMAVIERRIRVPGSWIPMSLMLGIFATRFAVGYGTAMHWQALHETIAVFAISSMLGVFSGGFASRAIGILRFAKSQSLFASAPR